MKRRNLLLAAAAGAAISLLGAGVSARAQSSFPDVPDAHWAAASVTRLRDAGIVKGYPAASAIPAAPARRRPAVARPGYDGNKPVTRYELAVTLVRFIDYLEGADKQPRKPAQAADGPAAVRRLVAGGYLPAATPLAKSGNATVTADQFADALSQVIVRVRANKVPPSPDSVEGGGADAPATPPARP
jgi:hypothetical protein